MTVPAFNAEAIPEDGRTEARVLDDLVDFIGSYIDERTAAAATLLVPLSQKGAHNGVGTLDSDGHQPLSELSPSVDYVGSAGSGLSATQGQTKWVRADGTVGYLDAPVIYAKAWGVLADGTADDTAAAQATYDAAVAAAAVAGGGAVPTIDWGKGSIKLTDTLNLAPTSGQASVLLHQRMSGQFLWAGGSNKSVIHSKGYVYSTIDGVNIKLQSGHNYTGVVGWDLDTDMTATPAQSSTGRLTFKHCHVTLAEAGNTGCTAYRICHSNVSSDGSESSFIHWIGCHFSSVAKVGSTTPGTGNIWIDNTTGNHNSVAHTVTNFSGSNFDALLCTGAAGWTIVGGGGSFFTTLIDNTTADRGGEFVLSGLVLEGTNRIFAGPASTRRITLMLIGVQTARASSPAATGDVLTFASPADVLLDNCRFEDRNYDGAFRLGNVFSTAAQNGARFTMRGGHIELSAATASPFTFPNPTVPWVVELDHVGYKPSASPYVTAFVGGGSTTALPTLASTAALTLPAGIDLWQVSGTTNITSIARQGGEYAGRRVKLLFTGTLTVVSGNNLSLRGDYGAVPGSQLTLLFDGTNWVEDSARVLRHNYTATTNPVVGSDNTLGYSPGSEWCNTSTGVLYKCVSNATGAAVWARETGADVQVFTSSGTWTKPAWVSTVKTAMLASGGAAGSGRRTASGTAATGGAAGAGGGYAAAEFNAAELTSTVAVTVGGTATGGAAQTSNDSNGNPGTGGSSTSFGTYARVQPGANGLGGSTATVALSSGGGGLSIGGNGAGATLAAAGSGGGLGNAGAPGGGSGGGLAGTPAFLAGGNGSSSIPNSFQSGGLGGATDGAAGGDGTAPADLNLAIPGSAGGGGASSILGAGGDGGNGAAYGAGGGGGGASLNGSNSGKGGNGGAGICVVISR